MSTLRTFQAAAVCILALTNLTPSLATNLLRGYVSQEQSCEPPQWQSGELTRNSFPRTFEGNWHCVTTVTDSSAQLVESGKRMESDIQFCRARDGRIVATWNQSGWMEAQAKVVSWSNTQAQLDRTDYYYGENAQGNWAARSRDRFTQVDPDKMVAVSYVDQYIDGKYIGRYHTQSVLYRAPASPHDLAANEVGP